MFLTETLCAHNNAALLRVSDRKKLIEGAGLCKVDEERKGTRFVGTTCVMNKKNMGESSRCNEFLLKYR